MGTRPTLSILPVEINFIDWAVPCTLFVLARTAESCNIIIRRVRSSCCGLIWENSFTLKNCRETVCLSYTGSISVYSSLLTQKRVWSCRKLDKTFAGLRQRLLFTVNEVTCATSTPLVTANEITETDCDQMFKLNPSITEERILILRKIFQRRNFLEEAFS